MGTNINETTFQHYDDCLMSGCPSHKMRVEYQNTSDYYSIYIDDDFKFGGDPEVLGTIIKLINGMKDSRVEIESMMKEALAPGPQEDKEKP